MPYKLIISLAGMVAIAVVLLSLAIGGEDQPVTGSAHKQISFELPLDMTLNRFSDAVPASCRDSSELLAIEHTFDTTRLRQLNAAMQILHNKSADPFWQPLVDLFKPKSIWLNPTDFSVGYSENAVEVNRQVKRIVASYPEGENSSSVYLSYDLRISAADEVGVVVNKLAEKHSLTIPVDLIKDKTFISVSKPLNGGSVSDCAVAILPLLLPELSWRTAVVPDKSYCLLHGLHETKAVIDFYINCSQSQSALTAVHQ
jgi:hypothetical protein